MRIRFVPGAARAVLLALLLSVSAPAWAQDVAVAAAEDPPLTVERLLCRGNENTSCEFILSHLYLSVGDNVDEREIREATIRLSWLPSFESVSIYLEKGSQRGRANVVVEVRESNHVIWEAMAGFHAQTSSVGQFFHARATHYNLFGEGKILDAAASTRVHIDGPVFRSTNWGVQYVDQHLFGSKRNFAAAGLWYQDFRREWDNGDVVDAEQLGLDLTFGRRLFSFSYLTVGYQFRPLDNVDSQRRQDDGKFDVRTGQSRGGIHVTYGWNSEDDPYFPTRGSRLHYGFYRSIDGGDGHILSFRKNWQPFDAGVWTLLVDTQITLGFQYSRLFDPGERFGGARKGLWYVTPFTRPYYNTVDARHFRELGVEAGVRFQTRSFGVVNLYVFGSRPEQLGGN
jgi:outer membrane protein assembly factor BamA